MGLNVGNSPVTAVYVGSTPVREVYVGSKMVWSATVQITLGTGTQAQDQLRAALSARGLNYETVTEIPFDIELVGTGAAAGMFRNCFSLTSVPDLDTSQVTNMMWMFYNCSSLTYVPDMDTSQVTSMAYMFTGCAALTNGNVRLIGRHPNVSTTDMISGSGLTREPFFDAAGNPIVPEEVHQVSLTNVSGMGTVHPLVSVTVPAGQVWDVQIEGTVTRASSVANNRPAFRIGSSTSGSYAQGASVNFSGTVSSTNATIAMVTNAYTGSSFTGTVTIRK